jgi:pimeloyl-ACP methyl ester carboxylesterase
MMRTPIAIVAFTLVLTTAPAARAATVDGANIHWTSQGSGRQTLILVHGWTCDDSSWQGQVPALSKTYRVITLDLPGHGRSGMPKAFSMEVFARAIEAVRIEAKVDKAVLAGHSMGTPVIRKYALMYPERVAALVLVDGLVQSANPGGAAPTGPPLPSVSGPARAGIIRSMFGPLTTPALQEHILKMMMAPSDAAAAGAFAATWDPSQWSDQKIAAPVLAVYAGTRAMATDQAVKGLYPNAEYYTIPETAHFLMMEKPAEFNRLLSTFIDKLR